MKILLLGGTGAMGAYLSELLAERGEDVYVTSRSDRAKDRIHFIKGNAHDTDFLKETLKDGFDVVVDFMIYNTEEFKKRVDMMVNSADQYIYFSSARVYAESKTPITENSPRLLDVCKDEEYLATDEYALTKARQENLLFQSASSNWTIVRPYVTYSSSRLQLGAMEKERWLFRALHGKNIVFSRDIAERTTTMTYGADVAKAIAGLIGNTNAYGKAVHITGTDSMKWKDVLNVYLTAIEEKTGNRPGVTMLESADSIPERLYNKYQVKYDRLYDRVFDNSLANELCGQVNYTTMEAVLKRCLEEFIDSKQIFSSVSWSFEGWADRLSNEWEPISAIPGWKNKCKYILSRSGVR